MRDYDAEEQLRQKKRERQRMENRRRARERQRRKRRMLMAATGTARSGSVGAGNLVDDRPDREGKTVGRFWRNNAGTDNDISVGYRR